MRSLIELDVSENDLTVFPSPIFELKQLRRLNVGMNKITMIPSDIIELTELKTLNIAENSLTVRSSCPISVFSSLLSPSLIVSRILVHGIVGLHLVRIIAIYIMYNSVFLFQ